MRGLGISLTLGACAMMIFAVFEQLFVFVARHPIIATIMWLTLVCVGTISLWLDDMFHFRSVDSAAMLSMSETELSSEFEPYYCDVTSCRYDNFQASFQHGRVAALSFDADRLILRDISNDEEFYRYVLRRLNLPYRTPSYADGEIIIWNNLGPAERVTLTPHKLIIQGAV